MPLSKWSCGAGTVLMAQMTNTGKVLSQGVVAIGHALKQSTSSQMRCTAVHLQWEVSNFESKSTVDFTSKLMKDCSCGCRVQYSDSAQNHSVSLCTSAQHQSHWCCQSNHSTSLTEAASSLSMYNVFKKGVDFTLKSGKRVSSNV